MTDVRLTLGKLSMGLVLPCGAAAVAWATVLAIGVWGGTAWAQDAMPGEPIDSSPESQTDDAGETGPDFDERAVEIFEKHIEALGGRDLVFSVDKRTIRGTYEGSPLSFPGRLYMVLEAPNKMFWQISEPAGLSLTTVYNGERGWNEVRQALQEPQINWVLGDMLTDLVECASFYGESAYEVRYTKLELIGTADFYGTTCFVVRGMRTSGKVHLLMFDQETGLYKGARTGVRHPSGDVRAMDVRIGEWQEVDGVKVPKTMIQQFRGEPASNVFKMDRVTHETDESLDWTPPAELGPYPELDERNRPVAPASSPSDEDQDEG
ncbi:MAG: hypothetical protein AAF297_10615 [Planctomycetota bacterium]